MKSNPIEVLGWERESPTVRYRGLEWPVEVSYDEEQRRYRARFAMAHWMESLDGRTRVEAVMAAAHWMKGFVDREVCGWQLAPDRLDRAISGEATG